MASAVSAGDLTLYRTHPQVTNSYLWVDKPPIVYQGLVNQAAAFTYPITAPVPVDNETGTLADVQLDMLITFGTTAGGDDLGRTRVLGSTATTIGIPRISQGTVDGTVKLSDNIHFTIWDTYPPAPKLPFFDEAIQTFYKDGDDVYTPPINPVANIGYSHIYADLVNSSDKLVLVIDSTDSFSPIGGTLTRLWDVEDGTITSGSTSSTAITVEFPVGRRWIKLTITDTTNSRATIRHLLIVACKLGDATYAPIVDAKAGTLTQTVEGVRQSFTFGQDIAASTYVDGMAVCYFQREFYGTTEDSLHDSTPVKFAGWHRADPARIQAQATHLLTEATLDCLDTAGVLAQLPGFPQTIESESSPARWEQMASPTLDKFLVYLWLYHSTASNLVDFTWSATTTTYPFVRLNASGNSMYGQVDGRARAIGYRLLSNVKGRCKVKKDSMLFDSGSRDSVNVISLTESDIASINYTHQRPPRSHWNRGNAVVASSSAVNAVFSRAPGVVPAWGLSSGEIGENLVASQTELNARVGHAYTRENAPEGYIEVELLHTGDLGLEPLDFIRITLSSDYAAQRGLTWTTQRFAIVAINTDYDPVYGTKRVKLTLEKEVFGVAAETEIPDADDTPNVDLDLFPPNDFILDNTSDLHKGVTDLAAIGDNGSIYQTGDFTTQSASGGPTWATAASGVSGTPIQAVPDPASPKYIETGTQVNCWIATTTGIYKVSSIEATPSAALQYTFRGTSSKRSMDFSFGTLGYGVCFSAYADGVYETHTSNSGTAWSAEALVGAATDLDTFPPGAYMSSKSLVAYLSAVAAGVGEGYKGTLPTPSFAALGTPDVNPGSELAGEIHVPFGGANENVVFHGKSSSGGDTLSYDFTVSDWAGVPSTDPQLRAVYYPGVGWKKSPARTDRITFTIPIPSSTVTNVTVFLSSCTLVTNVGIFIDTAFSYVACSGGQATYSPTPGVSANVGVDVVMDSSVDPSVTAITVETTTGTGRRLIRIASDGSTKTDISPIVSSATYGPWQSRGQVVSDATNQSLMAFALGKSDLSLAGIWVSRNRGDTMEEVIAPVAAGSRYERVAISSDGNGVVYLMGEDGKVGYMNSLDDTPDERGPGGLATIIAVMGL